MREKNGHFLPVFYVPIQLCIAFLFLFRNLLASGKDVREKVIKKVILLSRGAGKNGHFVPFFSAPVQLSMAFPVILRIGVGKNCGAEKNRNIFRQLGF